MAGPRSEKVYPLKWETIKEARTLTECGRQSLIKSRTVRVKTDVYNLTHLFFIKLTQKYYSKERYEMGKGFDRESLLKYLDMCIDHS